MSHPGARVLRVLKEDRPYELRDIDGNPISWDLIVQVGWLRH